MGLNAKTKLTWWQVLLFFAFFAGVIWFKTRKHEGNNAREVEAKLEELRQRACACPHDVCRAGVESRLESYLERIDGIEVYEKKAKYFYQIIEKTRKCIETPVESPPQSLY
jgi:hypothetical protein